MTIKKSNPKCNAILEKPLGFLKNERLNEPLGRTKPLQIHTKIVENIQMYEQLLTAGETRQSIETLTAGGDDVTILSAFFTTQGFKWISEQVGTAHVNLSIRSSPQDVASGSCDLEAVQLALDLGWDIRFSSSLHAKVYLIGDKLIVGSGNLTGNGMNLFGSGNFELNTILDADDKSRALVTKIFQQSLIFTQDILDKMMQYSETHPQIKKPAIWWPSDVAPELDVQLFCESFPEHPFFKNDKNEREPWVSIKHLIEEGEKAKASKLLFSTSAFIWLKKTLEANGGELYFGGVKEALHNDLLDTPKPYRSSITIILKNLLEYVENIPRSSIEITRPNHSQLVKLV